MKIMMIKTFEEPASALHSFNKAIKSLDDGKLFLKAGL